MKTNFSVLFLLITMSSFFGCAGNTPPFEAALKQHYPDAEAKRLADGINFPAKIALWAEGANESTAPNGDGDFLGELLEQADRNGDLDRMGTNKSKANDELQNIFREPNCSVGSPMSDQSRSQLINLAINRAAGQSGIGPEDAQQAIELIETGQFYRDIGSSVSVVGSVLPKLANQLIQEPQSISGRFENLFEEIRSDLRNDSDSQCLEDLNTGGSCEEPEVLRQIFEKLYQDPTLIIIRETTNELLNNKSIRLAIIVYAQVNGINIDNEDLAVAQQLLTGKDPDLENSSKIAIDRFVEKHGLVDAKHRLKTMGNSQNCGEI